MERKLLAEILELLRTIGTLKMINTDRVSTMITKIESTLRIPNKNDVTGNGGFYTGKISK
tara:strand:+ start:185 stop:364 length:180 start_codon:yes stop_codon:yes gene_type:complete